MTFNFDDTIPAANNNPSDDQPIMLANNVADLGIWNVDHLGYNAAAGGTHSKLTFENNPNFIAVPAAPLAKGAIGYTGAGTAAPTKASLFFVNSSATYLLNCVKAFGYASGTVVSPGNCIINSQSLNVTSVIRTSAGLYTVNLTAGAVSGTDFLILASSTGRLSNGNLVFNKYSITGLNTFTLLFDNSSAGTGVDVTSFSFIVIQI